MNMWLMYSYKLLEINSNQLQANIADVRAVILNIPASVNILYMTTLIEYVAIVIVICVNLYFRTNKYYGSSYLCI